MAATSSCRTTSTDVLLPTDTDCVLNPIKEKTRVEPSGTFNLYSPSTSVDVPVDVPGIETVTPGNGSPFGSVTLPETLISELKLSTGRTKCVLFIIVMPLGFLPSVGDILLAMVSSPKTATKSIAEDNLTNKFF